MDKILEKVEKYNIFNNLLPGIIFTYLLKFYLEIDIFQKDVIEMFFIYYFIGSIISRIGSIIIEPILQKIKFIIYVPYKEYLVASDKDSKIEELSMINNMYRTLSSTFIMLIVLKIFKVIAEYFKVSNNFIYTVIIVIGILLYLCSYKKQTQYIVGRVEKVNKK